MPADDFSLPLSEAVRLNSLNYQASLRAVQEGAIPSQRKGKFIMVRHSDQQALAAVVAAKRSRSRAA